MRKTNFKKIRYWLWDFIADILFSLSILIFRCLSPKSLVFISKMIGTLVFYVSKRYRERVLGNLSFALGREKDSEEIKKLARDVFFHFSLTSLESIYMLAVPLEQFLSKIKIKGREHLDMALAKGKGVIALGAHIGSFTLLGTRLAMEGYPFNIIINVSNFPKFMKKIFYHQKRLGQNPFPPKPASSSIKKSLNCLHRNEILYLIADEQQRRGGLSVLFFGQQAFTPSGPAIFSLKTGAQILPMFILRENGIQRTLVIGNPIQIDRTMDEKKDIESLTAKFTQVIEETIRQYPSQWPWLNRRWKLPSSKAPLDRKMRGV